MKLLACLLVIAVVLVSCHSSNEKTQSEQISSKEPVDTIVYAEYNAKKMFYTLTDGTAKEETISVLFRYSPQDVIVEFPDSTWTFEVDTIIQNIEGTTIKIRDKKFKKFKEIFIAAGDLLMINFITHTETGNLTLMQ